MIGISMFTEFIYSNLLNYPTPFKLDVTYGFPSSVLSHFILRSIRLLTIQVPNPVFFSEALLKISHFLLLRIHPFSFRCGLLRGSWRALKLIWSSASLHLRNTCEVSTWSFHTIRLSSLQNNPNPQKYKKMLHLSFTAFWTSPNWFRRFVPLIFPLHIRIFKWSFWELTLPSLVFQLLISLIPLECSRDDFTLLVFKKKWKLHLLHMGFSLMIQIENDLSFSLSFIHFRVKFYANRSATRGQFLYKKNNNPSHIYDWIEAFGMVKGLPNSVNSKFKSDFHVSCNKDHGE